MGTTFSYIMPFLSSICHSNHWSEWIVIFAITFCNPDPYDWGQLMKISFLLVLLYVTLLLQHNSGTIAQFRAEESNQLSHTNHRTLHISEFFTVQKTKSLSLLALHFESALQTKFCSTITLFHVLSLMLKGLQILLGLPCKIHFGILSN